MGVRVVTARGKKENVGYGQVERLSAVHSATVMTKL
jgi:hypothetical protein